MSSEKTVFVLDGNGKRGIFTYYMCNFIAKSTLSDPSLIIGVSAGAFVGALYACGKINSLNETEIINIGGSIQSNGNRRIPWNESIIPGEMKTQMFYDIFKGILFGDVNIPLAILVDGVGDKPLLFCSWKDEHAKIELYKILDATTAIPIIFPSAKVLNKHYVDAVLISTKPTSIAYLIATKFFQTQFFRMISIGTEHSGYVESSKPKTCNGIIDHFRHGLFSEMLIRRDDLMDDLLQEVMDSKSYLRIGGIIDRDAKAPFQEVHDRCKHAADGAYVEASRIMSDRGWMNNDRKIKNPCPANTQRS